MKKTKAVDLNEVVRFYGNEVRAGTLLISLGLDRSHENLIRTINNNKSDFEEYGKLESNKSRKIDAEFPDLKSDKTKRKRGRPVEEYWLNKQQATLLITYLRNLKKNDKVKEFKKLLVRRFFEMEDALAKIERQKNDPGYIIARQEGKIPRRLETNIVQDLIPYAIAQGSKGYMKNPDACYINYTAMTNNVMFMISKGLNKVREHLTKKQLRQVAVAEDIIADTIIEKMTKGLHYKEIYKAAKSKIVAYAELIGKTEVPSFQIENKNQAQLSLF